MEVHLFAHGHAVQTTSGISTNFYLFVDHSRCLAFYEDELDHRKDIEIDPIRSTTAPLLTRLYQILTFHSKQTCSLILELCLEPSHPYVNTKASTNGSVGCPYVVLCASPESYKGDNLTLRRRTTSYLVTRAQFLSPNQNVKTSCALYINFLVSEQPSQNTQCR